jgi:hypothetical protein
VERATLAVKLDTAVRLKIAAFKNAKKLTGGSNIPAL